MLDNMRGRAVSNLVSPTLIANQPTATINSAAPGTLYEAGETVGFSGTATDPQDETLPASAFTWKVSLHNGASVVPVLPPTSGVTSGSFTIPTTGDTSTDMFYRISLTVTDSGGARRTTSVDIRPRTATSTVATNPPGLQVSIDGQPGMAPDSFASVVGMSRVIEAPATQILGGTIYQFTGWSDGLSSPQGKLVSILVFGRKTGIDTNFPSRSTRRPFCQCRRERSSPRCQGRPPRPAKLKGSLSLPKV